MICHPTRFVISGTHGTSLTRHYLLVEVVHRRCEFVVLRSLKIPEDLKKVVAVLLIPRAILLYILQ